MSTKIKIGSLTLHHGIAMAPMEEHTHLPFRLMARRYGAGLMFTERIDGDKVARGNRRALRQLATEPAERPCIAQVSCTDPEVMTAAARVIEDLGFAGVDLNCDCPVNRVIARGEGGALMDDPAAIARLVAAAVKAVRIPVTVKLRSGPDAEHETAAEAGRLAAEAGAAALVVHGRSVAQAYAGPADWAVIGRVKAAVNIPVFASGNIRTGEDAAAVMRETGSDGVAIARGCLGNPWIFRAARALILGQPAPPPPSAAERGRVLMGLVKAEFKFFGRQVAARRLARSACYFAKSLPSFNAFKAEIQDCHDPKSLKLLIDRHFRG
jgi:tRNA-dihydrouridine synthase B